MSGELNTSSLRNFDLGLAHTDTAAALCLDSHFGGFTFFFHGD